MRTTVVVVCGTVASSTVRGVWLWGIMWYRWAARARLQWGGGRTVATVILILVRSRTPVAITTTRTGVVGSRGY